MVEQIDSPGQFVGKSVDFDEMECEDLTRLAINAIDNGVEDSKLDAILKCKVMELWINGADYEFLSRIKVMAAHLNHLYLDMTQGGLRIAHITDVIKLFNIQALFSIIIDEENFSAALDNLYFNDNIDEIHIVSKPREHVIIDKATKTATTTNYSILARSREFEVVQLLLQPEDTKNLPIIEKTLIENERKFGLVVLRAAHNNQLSLLNNPKISLVHMLMSTSRDTIRKIGEHISLYVKSKNIINKMPKDTRSLRICCGMESGKERKTLANTLKGMLLERLEIAMNNDTGDNDELIAKSFLFEFLEGVTSADLQKLTTLKLDMTTIDIDTEFSLAMPPSIFDLLNFKHLIIELGLTSYDSALASWFNYRSLEEWVVSTNLYSIICNKVCHSCSIFVHLSNFPLSYVISNSK